MAICGPRGRPGRDAKVSTARRKFLSSAAMVSARPALSSRSQTRWVTSQTPASAFANRQPRAPVGISRRPGQECKRPLALGQQMQHRLGFAYRILDDRLHRLPVRLEGFKTLHHDIEQQIVARLGSSGAGPISATAARSTRRAYMLRVRPGPGRQRRFARRTIWRARQRHRATAHAIPARQRMPASHRSADLKESSVFLPSRNGM